MKSQAAYNLPPQEREKYQKKATKQFYVLLVIVALWLVCTIEMIGTCFYYRGRMSMGGGGMLVVFLLPVIFSAPIAIGVSTSMVKNAQKVSEAFLKKSRKRRTLSLLVLILPILVILFG